MGKKLYKSRKNKMIGGVCGGLSEYLNIDVTIVRVIAGVLCLLKGFGFLVYIIACIVMPYDDEDFSEDDTENLKSANINPEDEKKANKSSKQRSSSKGAENGDSRLHSDDEFDSYFKK